MPVYCEGAELRILAILVLRLLTECAMESYVLKLMLAPRPLSVSAVAWPNRKLTTLSILPWHMSTGVALLASDRTGACCRRGM